MKRITILAKTSAPYIAVAVVFLLLSEVINQFKFQEAVAAHVRAISTDPLYLFIATSVCVFLETIVGVSFYFPGSVALVFVAGALDTDWASRLTFMAAANLGLVLGLLADVSLGRFARPVAKRLLGNRLTVSINRHLERFGIYWVLASSWHPNWLGATFTVLGLTDKLSLRAAAFALLTFNMFVALYLILAGSLTASASITVSNHHYLVSALLAIAGLIIGFIKALRSNSNANRQL